MAREKKNIEKLSFNMDKELSAALREYADDHYMTFTAALEFAVKTFLKEKREPGRIEKDKRHDNSQVEGE